MMLSWKEFWNRKNRIYVSERHLRAYYATLIKDLMELFPKKRPLALLDYGCGEARGANSFVHAGITVYAYDVVPYMRERAREHTKDSVGAYVLDDDAFALLSKESLDTIVVYSVLQYVSKDDFKSLLARFHTLLRAGGQLILGDIVPPSVSIGEDVLDLLRSGLKNGFFFSAVGSLVVTFFSNYRIIRKKNGFTTYKEEEIKNYLREAGFSVARLPKNIGLGSLRMSFVGEKKGL